MCEQRSWMRGRRKAIAYGLGRPCGVRMQGHMHLVRGRLASAGTVRRQRAEFRRVDALAK